MEVPIDVEGHATIGVLQRPDGPTAATLVLAHGAGGSADSPRLRAIADALCSKGLEVFRFDFLYRREGRSIPDRMPRLLACYRAAADAAKSLSEGRPLLLGGHSMGGRVASMLVADGYPCDGLVLLSYPLHPPGKPEQLRSEHLARIEAPVLMFSGTKDPFCTRELMEGVLAQLPPNFRMRWIDQADHSLHVPRSAGTDAAVREHVADELAAWVKSVGGGPEAAPWG